MKSNKLLFILASFTILLLTLSVVSAGVINNSNNGVNDDSSINKVNSGIDIKKVDSDKSDIKKINSVDDDYTKDVKEESSDKKDNDKNKKDLNNTTIKETTLKLQISSSHDFIEANLKEESHNLVGEVIIFTIEKDGKEINKKVKTDENGIAKLDIGDFPSGKYHVTALFKGNDNYKESSDDIRFNISKIPTKLSLVKNNKVVYAKLVDNSSNSLSNEKIIFVVKGSNGKIIKEKSISTNTKGIAAMDLSDLSEGKYIVNAIFKGNSELDSSYSNIITFEFTKIKTHIKIIPDLFSQNFVSAILFDEKGKPLSNKVLTFTVTKSGKTVLTKSVSTNKKGLATISGIDLKNSSISVSFSGDKVYSSSSNSFSYVMDLDTSLNTTNLNSTNSSKVASTGLLSYLSSLFGGVFSYLDGAFNGALSGLMSYLNNIFKGISAFINNIISYINGYNK